MLFKPFKDTSVKSANLINMDFIKSFFVQMTCLLVLLAGIQGGEFSTWSFESDNLSELSIEVEKEIQEEIPVDWFNSISCESSKNFSVSNPLLSTRNALFFPRLNEKALDNPPEATL